MLLEALNAAPRRHQVCGVAKALASIEDPQLRSELETALTLRNVDPDGRSAWRYPSSRLSRELARLGIRLSDQTIRRHRQGVCSC